MALTDILHRVMEICEVNGQLDQGHVTSTGVPLVKADPEAVDECVRETVWRRVGVMTKRLPRLATATSRQAELFPGLRTHYAVDTEGRVLKQTGLLSQLEFDRVIAIREKQVADDAAHLKVLKDARADLRGLWNANPALTFSQVEALFRRSQAA
jgi:hypothetical protein